MLKIKNNKQIIRLIRFYFIFNSISLLQLYRCCITCKGTRNMRLLLRYHCSWSRWRGVVSTGIYKNNRLPYYFTSFQTAVFIVGIPVSHSEFSDFFIFFLLLINLKVLYTLNVFKINVSYFCFQIFSNTALGKVFDELRMRITCYVS